MEQKITTGIKVKIRVPEKVSENIKRHKINKIYDILKPSKNVK